VPAPASSANSINSSISYSHHARKRLRGYELPAPP
jgi:hypothetical protein